MQAVFRKNEGQIHNQWCQIYSSEHIQRKYKKVQGMVLLKAQSHLNKQFLSIDFIFSFHK